jgi:hypothetical protein
MKELRDDEITKGKAAIAILYCSGVSILYAYSTEKRCAKIPAMKRKILGKNYQK